MRVSFVLLVVSIVLGCVRQAPPRTHVPWSDAPFVPRQAKHVAIEVSEWSCWGGSTHVADFRVEGPSVDVRRDGSAQRWTLEEWDVARGRMNASLVETWPDIGPRKSGSYWTCAVGPNWHCAFRLHVDGVTTLGCCETPLFETMRSM